MLERVELWIVDLMNLQRGNEARDDMMEGIKEGLLLSRALVKVV